MAAVEIRSGEHRSVVGESPVFDPRTGALHWVDIIGCEILTLDVASGARSAVGTGDFPTAIGLCETPGLAVVAFASGVFLWTIGTAEFEPFATIDDEPSGNRLNEGAVGPDGSFWVGSMQTNLNADGSMRDMDRSSGALHVIRPDRTARRVTPYRFGISNTLVWTLDGASLIVGDTLEQTLYRTDWPVPNAQDAELEPWATTRERGFPDGSCLDAEGYLWNARYGGRCLLRYAPDGSLDRVLDLPATNITACGFGGPDLATLFVTTAANQLDETALENPHEGALLAINVGVRGLPSPYFGA